MIILRQGAVCRDEALDRSQPGVEQRRQRLLQRDLVNLSAIERIADLARLLRLLAVRSSTVLNVDGLARDADMPTTTVRRYLTLLDAAYLVVLLPAWSNNRTTRAIRAPKIVLADSGLCTHLVGADADRLASPLGDAGPLLETLVATEIASRSVGASIAHACFHYRTGVGVEVDIVLETPDGRVVGIEVKAAATVRGVDFAGLRHLAARTGDRFKCGLVLYTGRQNPAVGSETQVHSDQRVVGSLASATKSCWYPEPDSLRRIEELAKHWPGGLWRAIVRPGRPTP